MSTRQRLLGRALGVSALILVVTPTTVVAQPSVEQAQSVSVFTRVISSAVITLLAGGAFFVFARETADATIRQARDDPFGSFIWGLGIGIAVIVGGFLLGITGIGLLIAIPLLLVFAVVAIATQAVMFVMVFESLLDSNPPVGKALVGAAVLAGILSAIPVVGPLASFVIGSVGIGALFLTVRQ